MPTLLRANYDYDCIIIVAVFSWIIVLFHYCTVLFMLMLMMMMLIKLYHISYHWQMLFNVEKCVVMHIGTNNKLYSYNMNNATHKTVDVERDLSVIINKK